MDVGETVRARNRDQWRRWLARHHDDKKEIWLLYFKKSSGKTGVSYDESVEEALAYGWIDGQIKSIDDQTYAGRFTPRKPNSNWSSSNLARVKKLLAEGRMAAPGLAVIPSELRKSLPHMRQSDPLPRSRGRVRVGA
jgi:uncharacterized protein YdeI (YjbR/CyaY-like superfamily)